MDRIFRSNKKKAIPCFGLLPTVNFTLSICNRMDYASITAVNTSFHYFLPKQFTRHQFQESIKSISTIEILATNKLEVK